MGALTPLAFGLLALAAPIVALYMLKMRRREQLVSSTFLWQQALRDVQANAPWQRLRPNLLLFLQLLALLALVAALARPFWFGPTPLGANLVVILDVSGSMSATDGGDQTRLVRAKARVRALIDDLPANGTMTLLAAGSGAEVLQAATANRAALREGVERARPRSGTTDFREALALAVPAAERLPDTTVVIVSDGGFPDPGPAAADLRVPVTVIRIGERSENLAITAAATRRTAGSTAGELFVRVQNFGQAERKTLLSIYDDRTLIEARALTVPAHGEAGTTIGPLPPAVGLLRAEIDAADDLALDNRAWIRPGAAGKLRVLLTGAGPNTFLERGLALQPNLVVDRAQGGEGGGANSAGDYDLYVYDGVAPPDGLRGPVLLIDPPAENPILPVKGAIDRPVVTGQDREHPVMKGLDLAKVQIAQAAAFDRPEWARTLADANGAPLLVAGEPGGRRTVVLGFTLQRSDLPLTLHFPILLANLTGWLAPEAGTGLPEQVRPGEVVPIAPRGGVESVAIVGPDGRERRFAPTASRANTVLFPNTDLPGAYAVRELQGDREIRRGAFTVNLFSAEESNVAPRDVALGGGPAKARADSASRSRRELWRPFLLVGLVVLALEWWYFYRGAAAGRPAPPGSRAPDGVGGVRRLASRLAGPARRIGRGAKRGAT